MGVRNRLFAVEAREASGVRVDRGGRGHDTFRVSRMVDGAGVEGSGLARCGSMRRYYYPS